MPPIRCIAPAAGVPRAGNTGYFDEGRQWHIGVYTPPVLLIPAAAFPDFGFDEDGKKCDDPATVSISKLGSREVRMDVGSSFCGSSDSGWYLPRYKLNMALGHQRYGYLFDTDDFEDVEVGT